MLSPAFGTRAKTHFCDFFPILLQCLPVYDLLLFLFISKTSLWDPSVLTEAVNEHLLLSQKYFTKGLVSYEVKYNLFIFS